VEHARDFHAVISDAVEDRIGMRKHRSQPRQQLIPPAPSERVPPNTIRRATYFPQNAISNVARPRLRNIARLPRRSRLAAGAQVTRLAAGMLLARLPYDIFDFQRLALASVEFAHTDFDRGPQLGERADSLEHLAPELLLSRFGKRDRLRDRQFQCLDHQRIIAGLWFDAHQSVRVIGRAAASPIPAGRLFTAAAAGN
jgi:hypothetical protein